MSKYVEKAMENHKKGYNCAQAVVCAFADKIGMEETVLFRISEGFGSGMGNKANTCGALAGAVMLAGLVNSSGDAGNMTKASTYKLSGAIANEFAVRCKAVVCEEIKGEKNGIMTVSCGECVKIAAELAENILFESK